MATFISVHMGDKSTVEESGYKSMEIVLDKTGKSIKCRIENGLYVPSLLYLLSFVAMLAKKEMEVSFYTRNVSITKNKILCATATRNGSLHIF